MKLHYSIAAVGWIAAAASVGFAQTPAGAENVAYADTGVRAPQRKLQDAATNFKNCHDWVGVVTEERPTQVRVFELCPGGNADVLNTQAIVRAGSLVARDGSLYLDPAPLSASRGAGALVAGPIPQGASPGGTPSTVLDQGIYSSPLDYGAPPFSASPGDEGVPVIVPPTASISPPGAGGLPTGGAGDPPVGVSPPTGVGVPPSTGTGGGTTPPVAGGGSRRGHANNGFGNGGRDGVPGRSAKQDLTR